ncbi:MAG TPA: histidine kinase dimerization/phosphoacceptor domain -containing protein [Methanospirillum sp.]|uniref:histidine kinase dimerization/phosphoacceptor domain -containing protein n=1 Tax=Methanospirillum sp. TaxID=45200 RepID=UPI002CB28CE2|nr:histidine kinase dimerization/phosphoacceptor domain -containing protein [Methanospirillum sp.]HWQ64696.1 histidine kinase dimerization/phosphoacceptor domain -containing protein [Methanospirillum sp.]
MIPVLFIDDNKELCTLFQIYLEESGEFSVFTCYSGEEALTYLKSHPVMAVISDYDMPEMNGIDLLRQIREIYPRLPFIMLTGDDSKDTAIDALNAGADFYQNKADDFEVQVLDLSHKVRVLSERHMAEDAAQKKGEILAAISHAAERLLRGSGWQEDIEEVLGRLGHATNASSIFVAGKGDEMSGAVVDPVIWQRSPDPGNTRLFDLIHAWWQEPQRAHLLEANQEIQDLFDPILSSHGISSTILLIPIFLARDWWGVLGITDQSVDRVFSPEEVSALRMAARVIGSARYRMYIEEIFRNPVEESLVGVFIEDKSRFLYTNPKVCQMFGYSREEIHNIVDPLIMIHPKSRAEFVSIVRDISNKKIPYKHFETAGVKKDGSTICLEVYLTTLSGNSSDCLFGNIMDVSDQHRARKALAESEKRFRSLFSNIRDLVFLHRIPTEGSEIIEINDSVCETLELDREHVLFRPLSSFSPREHEYSRILSHCENAATAGRAADQTCLLKRDGFPIPVDLVTHRIVMEGRAVLLSVARDITERIEAEAKIRTGEERLKRNMLLSLREKETLLREIHHRVKNNMQIIISLLKLQDFKVEDPKVHEIIRDCRSRIYSMAVIHEKLYQTDELTSIRLDEYITDLADRVMHEFDCGEDRVSFALQSDNPVLVDIGTGIPLGLILNELITNSMKYAFDQTETGEINVVLQRIKESLVITVADTGHGLPEGFSIENSSTLGIELIRGLAFQLDGKVAWKSDHGTICTLTIPYPKIEVGDETPS